MPISTIGQNGLNAPLSLTSPNLGTPSSLVLTNATGLPQAGLGTNVAGNGPAFSAYYSSGTTSISNSTWTKVNLATEEFDTNNNFASNRFTPTIAGYYQINGAVYMSGGAALTQASVSIYKNGTSYKYAAASGSLAALPFNAPAVCVSSIVYFNGSTDYVELYCYIYDSGASPYYAGGISVTWFNGAMVRSA